MKNKKRHNIFTKKQRRRMRAEKWPDMKPHIFDKVAVAVPHVFKGFY